MAKAENVTHMQEIIVIQAWPLLTQSGTVKSMCAIKQFMNLFILNTGFILSESSSENLERLKSHNTS